MEKIQNGPNPLTQCAFFQGEKPLTTARPRIIILKTDKGVWVSRLGRPSAFFLLYMGGAFGCFPHGGKNFAPGWARFVKMGVDELSVSPPLVLRVRKEIRETE